jgi:hypothetical protein
MKKQACIIFTVFVIFAFFSCKTTGGSLTRPDKALLTQITAEVNLGFSGISKTEFTWQKAGTGTQSSAAAVKGFEISARIKINGDYSLLNGKAQEVSAYLTSKGFIASELNISEIAGGYKKDNLVCLIITQTDPGSDNYSTLTVKCGQLE